jgi:membrane-bound serine protease (ClpP class)
MDDLTLAYGLILLGLVLILAELFLYTHGVLFTLGLASIIVGVTITFNNSASIGAGTLLAVIIAVPALLAVGLHYAPKTPLGRRFFLAPQQEDDTLATTPENLELEHLRGRYGRTVSSLRPSGVSDFAGRRVDTITEGEMIDPGQWVRVTDVKAGKVIVRAVEGPPDLNDMETAEFD